MTLPDGWERANLLDVVALHDSRRVPLNAEQRAALRGDYPYYGANGQVGTVGDYLFDGEYILLAEDGGYFDQPERGVAYQVEGRFWVNNHAHILSTLGEMPASYVRRLLNTLDWMNFVSGTTRLKLTQSGMQRIQIPVPPLAEQRRIVAKLDALTARLARARAELDRVPAMAKFLRETAVETLLNPDGRGAVSWRQQQLGSLLTEGPSNGWSPKSDPGAQGALTLKLTATTRGKLRLDEAATKRIHEVPPPTSSYWLRPGDLLVQRANALEHVGATAIFDGPSHTYIYPDLMMRLRIASPTLTRLVWYRLNSPTTRQYFRDRATGTAGNMPKINGKVVRELPIALPPESEWTGLIHRLDTAFARANRLEAEAARARALLDRLEAAILAKAFRGDLVPQDPNDEPASVLLERIRARRATEPKPKRGRRASAAAG